MSVESVLDTLTTNVIKRYQRRQVEPATETDAYANGDVLFAPIEIDSIAQEDTSFVLDTVLLTNDDEVNQPIDLVFLKSGDSIGAVNAAATLPTGSDLLGTVAIVAADFVDKGDFSAAEKTDLGLIFSTPDDSQSIYVAGIAKASITFTTTSGLGLSLGFRRW